VNDPEILDALDRVVPRYDDRHGDWDAVASALRRRRTARVGARALAAVALAVGGAVLLWPSSHQGGVVDRAIAAVGDGPVLHLVLRAAPVNDQTLVDLRTGERKLLSADREVWYDPERGLHVIDRIGGVVESDELYTGAAEAHDQLVTLGGAMADYKEALESGQAKVSGTGEVDGTPVYWIKLNVEMLPGLNGKLHEFAYQVAVSRKTYKPIATRVTEDDVTSPNGITRILRLELTAAGSGNFERLTPSLDGVVMRLGRVGELTTAKASDVLGRPALWLGQEFQGIPLTRIARLEASRGYSPATGRWGHTKTGATFIYGPESGASPKPYVHLWEATTIVPEFFRGRFVPPEGSLLLVTKGMGTMKKDGLYVSIEGSSEDLVLAAARALRQVGG
jgi:hypothetical protein